MKYLGHFITVEMTDDTDIDRQCRRMYAQGNTLARKFGMFTENVRVCLFRATFINRFLKTSYKRKDSKVMGFFWGGGYH